MTPTPVDPILPLALAVHNGKGIYALLLGSGISQAAGVPTGWQIVSELVEKLRKLNGDEAVSESAEEWYRRTYKAELNYSDILRRLTQTGAERLQLLRQFFEPTEDERSEGIKLPTAAHRAIAKLVAKGYVRVIITTNFDRLLEQALSAEGVEATVISTTDSIRGAVPLAHSPCTIVKIHGDYLDARLRNTEGELSKYEAEFDRLLDAIFDQYGLVVCGWSADWDIALRAALERCSTRRYGTYWAIRGEPKAHAQKLTNLRRAITLTIQDADAFFSKLQETVQAVADSTLTDPISARVAVARVKRYLSPPEDRIRLNDAIVSEADRAEAAIRALATPGATVPGQGNGTAFLHQYEKALESLLPMLACVARWGNESDYDLITDVIRQIAHFSDDATKSSYTLWRQMGRYPAMVLFYGVCLAAAAKSDRRLINKLLRVKLRASQHEAEEYLSAVLAPYFMWSPNEQRGLMAGREKEHSPLNNHLYELMQRELKTYFRGSDAFDKTFDWFEYLVAINYADKHYNGVAFSSDADGNPIILAPLGRFFWKSLMLGENILNRMQLENPGSPSPEVLAMMGCGVCTNIDSTLNDERYNVLKGGIDRLTKMARLERNIYF
jgi:hypothetical protein